MAIPAGTLGPPSPPEFPPGFPALRDENGVYWFRVSGLGRCIRGLVAPLLEFEPMPPTAQMKRWFGEGNIHEPHILEGYEKETGRTVGDRQAEVRVYMDLRGGVKAVLLGHIDGVEEAERLVEVKTVGQWTWVNKVKKWGLAEFFRRERAYAYQLTSYAVGRGLVDVDPLVIVKNRNTGETTWDSVPIPLPLTEPMKRVQKVLDWVEMCELPPCDGDNCSQGPWWHIHEKKVKAIDQVQEKHRAQVEDKIAAYIIADDSVKEMEAQKKRLKSEIKTLLGGKGRWKTDAGDVRIEDGERKSLSPDKVRERLGDEAMEECYVTTKYPEAVTISRPKKSGSSTASGS